MLNICFRFFGGGRRGVGRGGTIPPTRPGEGPANQKLASTTDRSGQEKISSQFRTQHSPTTDQQGDILASRQSTNHRQTKETQKAPAHSQKLASTTDRRGQGQIPGQSEIIQQTPFTHGTTREGYSRPIRCQQAPSIGVSLAQSAEVE